jgi:hypothetical protein
MPPNVSTLSPYPVGTFSCGFKAPLSNIFPSSLLCISPMRLHSHHLPGLFHITPPAMVRNPRTRPVPHQIKGPVLLLLDPRPSSHGQSSLAPRIAGTLRQCPHRRICHRSPQPQRHIGALDIIQHNGISTASMVSQRLVRKFHRYCHKRDPQARFLNRPWTSHPKRRRC